MGDTHQFIEGRDIFASDMQQQDAISEITTSFQNTTFFITGGTGFIGKIFLEKLLRISKTVKVLILVRPKKDKNTLERFQEIFEGPNMVPLKLANPHFMKQIRLISGNCYEKNLGLSAEDKQMLIDEVNYVIHCAATVNFDEDLKTAAYINVRAVKDLIGMAKQMKDLRAFLHVSTAYSHCYRKFIDESFYEVAMRGEDLLHMVESMDQKRLDAITPQLIKEWPNTYVFTKAIAEDVIKNESGRLPIAILRPSIVLSSVSEPLAGWIDSFYGLTGMLMAVTLGFMRVFRVKSKNKGDLIPADYVTNAGFGILWDLSKTRSLNDNIEFPSGDIKEDVTIYNAVSSAESPIVWDRMLQLLLKEGLKIPSPYQIWYPLWISVTNPYIFTILSLLLQTIPAYLMDFICYCMGKQQRMVKGYRKLEKFSSVTNYFSLREWQFSNKNLQALWKKLEPEDQRLFKFSMKNFDWKGYVFFYIRGFRVYLLKDPLETVPKGKAWMRWLKAMHYTSVLLLSFLALTLLYNMYKFCLSS
ncbi:fatty acyl-CoA reductase wat-like [Harmonia axyridis]|uniref:fatty acyl-CoA reductase wat-like n=1 Tax=Harmonia axyridis TaxID=115357 RepID=UPI001E274FF6|nr:fatty acyl-CoA reductase wat-like [Harmonia axyridis]